MNEASIPLPPDVVEALQAGCRDCLFARNLLSAAIQSDLDPIAEARRINAECSGWQGEHSPQETLINSKDGPAMGIAASIEESCGHPIS